MSNAGHDERTLRAWRPARQGLDLTLAGKAPAAALASTQAYVRDQVGDARTFSLDSPKSRGPRIEARRKADLSVIR